ncbi:hypothetical protein ILUMI_08766 [Ignelater luminosus]|uniref:THO complex subunit 5 n=1 Tax=Ignelater luminosus TaxID=2038154 RepID=A0A8K0D714_IGNLU|nr:hypothetical protein ILUMI_08766 [Ignelater luminosus]
MVKEAVSGSSRETSIKKRRKNPSTENDSETDVYKKVISFEEKESKRSADTDAKLYCDLCKSIRTALAEIFELKSQKPPDASAKIMEKSMQAASCIVTLKKLNRLEKVRSTSAREALNLEKQKVDSTNLQYQNLMYEAAHLFSEFKKCKQFKSKDEDIELVSIEEFLSEAPEEKTKPFRNLKLEEMDDIQKHELHLARLEWELTQRKKLSELCNTFEDEKKQVAAEIVKSKNRLGGLAPRLAIVLESTKPLQEYLGLPIEKTYAEHKLASLLPNPLYLFYANADAYKKVYDIDLNLEILGDQDEAIQWRQQGAHPVQVDESDPENDQQEVEENVEIKKRRHRKASHIDRQEERKKRLLEAHPLSIQVTVRVKDGPTLKIQFSYRTVLNIITVMSDVVYPSNITGNVAKEVIGGESMLGELFEGDFGIDSPNPSNPYQLKKIDVNSYNSLVSKLGYAYSWAQRVCGLDFLIQQSSKAAAALSSTNVEIVMKVLTKRLKSRTALANQLQQLEQNLIPAAIEVDLPRNSVSSLTKWTSITYQDFCKSPSTTDLVLNELISPSDLFYSATIFRPKTATLNTLVAIKNDYPNQAPIFSLIVKYNGEFHSGNCDEVRDMERAVNVGWDYGANSASWLLSAQLQYLCSYFDVYLETTAPSVFPQNSVFFKNICARNRRRPFKFRKVGSGIFTQF